MPRNVWLSAVLLALAGAAMSSTAAGIDGAWLCGARVYQFGPLQGRATIMALSGKQLWAGSVRVGDGVLTWEPHNLPAYQPTAYTGPGSGQHLELGGSICYPAELACPAGFNLLPAGQCSDLKGRSLRPHYQAKLSRKRS